MTDLVQFVIPTVGSFSAQPNAAAPTPTPGDCGDNNGSLTSSSDTPRKKSSSVVDSEDGSGMFSFLWRAIASSKTITQPAPEKSRHFRKSSSSSSLTSHVSSQPPSTTPAVSPSTPNTTVAEDVHSFFSKLLPASPKPDVEEPGVVDSTVVATDTSMTHESVDSSAVPHTGALQVSSDDVDNQKKNSRRRRRRKRQGKGEEEQNSEERRRSSQGANDSASVATKKCEQLPKHILLETFQRVMSKGLQLDLHQTKGESTRVSTYYFWVDEGQTSLMWSKSRSSKPRGIISLTHLDNVEDVGPLEIRLHTSDTSASRAVQSVTISTSSTVEKTLLFRSFSLFLSTD